jgi:hypothetical protein
MTFVLHVHTGGELDPADAFATVGLFNVRQGLPAWSCRVRGFYACWFHTVLNSLPFV